MTDPKQTLNSTEISTALNDRGLTGWAETTTDGASAIAAEFGTGDFATGLKLVNLLGESAEEANHHPDVVLTYPSVQVTLTSHDVGGVTSRDLDLAEKISAHASSIGADT